MTSGRGRRNARSTAKRYTQEIAAPEKGFVTFDVDLGAYKVTFPAELGEKPDIYSLEDFMSRPALAEDLANYFRKWGVGRRIVTRKKKLGLLRFAFTFLDVLRERFRVDVRTLADIDTETFRSYIKWLDGSEPFGKASSLGNLTKIQRYNAFGEAYLEMSLQPKYRGQEIASIPKAAWRHVRAHRQPLNLIDTAKLFEACRREMRVILDGLDYGAKIIERYEDISIECLENNIVRGDKESSIAALFKYASERGGRVERLRLEFPRIGFALKNPHITVEEAIKNLVLTYETAVPLVLHFAAESVFNPSELFALLFSQFQPHPVFEGRDWLVAPKGRKGHVVSRSFAADDTREFSIPRVLNILARTARIAKRLGVDEHDNHVFLCHTWLGVPPKPMYTRANGTTSSWYRCLSEFLERNGLLPANLTDLRLTVSDIVNMITDGDILAQQRVLNHATSATTMRSYGSAAQMARRAAKLAQAMAHRQRVLDSLGKIPLNSYFAQGFSVGATPGFRCLDPLTSPVPGEFEGRPCIAYGKCPACPHGVIDLDDVQSVAQL
ncbi:hypothetical protein [Neorhizobium sp. T6_25]|uniref:hypothetical protein n=1 Tax=Neorhizobium sp. T6_25 TaxID=2093833 RepID=UPI00155E01CE|nr:hypothetical protein [Neorhizobium sp. T6_25]